MLSRILYATGSATATAAAQLTVQSPTGLVGLQWAVDVDSVTDNAIVVLEISSINAFQAATNDARGSISSVRYRSNFVTSGLAQGGINLWIPTAVRFRPQDILYLHVTVGGTATYVANITTWWQ